MSATNSDPPFVVSQQFEIINEPTIDEPEIAEAASEEYPTESHQLANVDHKEKSAAQIVHGYSEQVYHVKALPESPLGGLDLKTADEEEFSPDKLRANIERLYMTFGVGMLVLWKHIARLRSWRELNRTIAFAAVYFGAWTVDFLVPTIIAFLLVLVIYPPARSYCFPPAPIALIDFKTGGVKKQAAGVVGSDNSLTGAPEKDQGEAVEQEASNFVNGDKASGAIPNSVQDKTKEPISAAMWSKTRPVMHAIGDISDGWERFGNASSSTTPFPKDKPRIKLAAVLAPIFLVSVFTSSYMFTKIINLLLGFGFLADPVIWRAAAYLNKKFPQWQKLWGIRNTLLKGVPTNAQLTVTLLRIGEANKAPLPPPPSSGAPLPNIAYDTAGQNKAFQMTADAGTKRQHGRHTLAAIRGVTKGTMETALGTDKLKAAAGAENAKNRLGVLKSGALNPAGPVDFPCRFKGKKVHAYTTNTATSPALSWTNGKEDIDPIFSIAISEIQEVKKVGGLGWKTKLVVGWATSREITDGLIIVDKLGNQKHLTTIALREELFNRLITMGKQMWEAWGAHWDETQNK
ncbi:hypothetical protein PZA11_002015 [Diplocarpon coronariae]